MQPIAIGATHDQAIVGLALAEVPLVRDQGAATLLSVFVDAASPPEGIGTALLHGVEAEVARRGHARLAVVYMTGRPLVDALEALLARRGWSVPATRAMTMRATLEELLRMPWYGRVRLAAPDFEIFPWTGLRPDEKRRLAMSQQTQAWITEGLEPWRHDHAGFDEVSSVGLRHRGEVVGWVINHRLANDVVRFSGAFVREDHARRGRIFALYTHSIERLSAPRAARSPASRLRATRHTRRSSGIDVRPRRRSLRKRGVGEDAARGRRERTSETAQRSQRSERRGPVGATLRAGRGSVEMQLQAAHAPEAACICGSRLTHRVPPAPATGPLFSPLAPMLRLLRSVSSALSVLSSCWAWSDASSIQPRR